MAYARIELNDTGGHSVLRPVRVSTPPPQTNTEILTNRLQGNMGHGELDLKAHVCQL